jgi:hypothetical protein
MVPGEPGLRAILANTGPGFGSGQGLAAYEDLNGLDILAGGVGPVYHPGTKQNPREAIAMRRWLVFGWIFLGGAAAMAQPPVKVASIEGVTEYRLANGARVLLFPEASRPTVTVNMTVLVGSRHEGYGESGMAHLLEHMVFKGTPYHPQIPKALRDHGASFNGTTNSDRTNYKSLFIIC